MEITSPIPFNQDTSGPVFKNMNNVLKLNMKMTRILIHKKKMFNLLFACLICCLPETILMSKSQTLDAHV